MIIKFLGFLDFLSSMSFLMLQFAFAPLNFTIAMICYLGLKGFTFRSDINGIFDIISAFFLLMSLIGIRNWIITFIFAFYLGQKGVTSMFSH